MQTRIPSRDRELQEILERLFSRTTFGVKLGLTTTRELLSRLGDPQERLKTIHVAGTNGKGSVCSMLASILMEAGYRVGLFSSPHLVTYNERIRINGRPIDDDDLKIQLQRAMPLIEEAGATFFEGTTAIAFRYFAEQEVDLAVVETGMGGRLDSTNVVNPIVSVITSISRDHTRHLGSELNQIAREKAGIIKTNTPSVVGPIDTDLRSTFAEVAQDQGSPLTFVEDVVRMRHLRTTLEGTICSIQIDGEEEMKVELGLSGEHQVKNAATALVALSRLRGNVGVKTRDVRQGLRCVRENTGIAGRFYLWKRDPDTLLDVAHNESGAEALANTLRAAGTGDHSVNLVFGAVEEKEVVESLKHLRPLIKRLYAVRSSSPRSQPSEAIASVAREVGVVEIETCGSPDGAVEKARKDATSGETVVACGSFFVVADILNGGESPDPSESFDPEQGKGPGSGTGNSPRSSRQTKSGVSKRQGWSKPRDGRNGSSSRGIRAWQVAERPRERLMRQGAGSLSTAELVAILLRSGTQDEDAVQIARKLLARYGSLGELAARDYSELQGVTGIGPAKAVTLAATFELSARIGSEPFESRPVIQGPADVARMFIPRLRSARKEQFHAIMLNTAGQIIRTELVSEGNLNSSIVHPREVFRTAIIERAASIIGLHNHPSGNPAPSPEDILITRQLLEAGEQIGIPLHDHIIIAGDQYTSLVEERQINS